MNAANGASICTVIQRWRTGTCEHELARDVLEQLRDLVLAKIVLAFLLAWLCACHLDLPATTPTHESMWYVLPFPIALLGVIWVVTKETNPVSRV